jgi:hypothetical protein
MRGVNAVSAGTGPRAAIPSAFARTTAGRMIAFLRAEVPALAGVRVQPADQDPRAREAEALREPARQYLEHRQQPVDRQRVRHGAQRQVRRRERHAQLPGDQQHHRQRCARQLGEELRVARERHARVVDHALLHRCGDHRGELAAPAAFGGVAQHLEHVRRVGGIEAAGDDGRRERGRQHLQTAPPVRTELARGGALQFQRQPEVPGARGEQVRVGRHREPAGPVPRGEREAEIRPDAGGLAGGHDDRRRCGRPRAGRHIR